MCGRYVLAAKIKSIEARFNVKIPDALDYSPSYNVCPGQWSVVITDDKPHELQLFRFGMTPSWAKKSMMLINARAEGSRNKNNDSDYHGAKGIITKPSFSKPIRSQRCLVIADCFIEGTNLDKLNKPYLVYMRNKQRPFAMAGLWDVWYNSKTGENINSFAIITTIANSLVSKIPHDRMPVILEPHNENVWLSQTTPLSDITQLLRPYSAELMNAYPVSSEIKDVKANSKDLLQPTGQVLIEELKYKLGTEYKKFGMGRMGVKN